MRPTLSSLGLLLAVLAACSSSTHTSTPDATVHTDIPTTDVAMPSDATSDASTAPDALPAPVCAMPMDAGTDVDTDAGTVFVDAPPPDRLPTPPPLTTETCTGSYPSCTPSTGTTAYVRIHGTVVTPDTVICDGEVLYATDAGTIVCVGADCSAHPEATGATVVCANGVISPGLIDPHQHMAYNHLPVWQHPMKFGDRGQWDGHDGYDEFTAPYTAIHTAQSCRIFKWSELRAVMGGATSIIGSPGFGSCDSGLTRNLDITGANGLPSGLTVTAVTFPLDSSTAALMAVQQSLASGASRAYLAHLGEGIDATARSEFTPFQVAGMFTSHVAVVHGSAFTAQQLAWFTVGGTTLVWSPRSNIDLYGETAEVTAAHTLGVPIALGVDWTPSGSVSPLGELQCAAHLNSVYFNNTFHDRELVDMATITAAHAANLDDRLGQLTAGYLADILVVAGDRSTPYRTILNAMPSSVRLVVVGGKGIYGDADALAGPVALNAWCESVPGMVCGQAKTVCLRTTATAESIATVQSGLVAALSAAEMADTTCTSTSACYQYGLDPLFDPSTCTGPELARCDFGHPGLSGVPTNTDYDGDGVPDGSDNCPMIFNAPRIVATQDDVDGDGIGDVCDPCPLDPDSSCTAVVQTDVDGDGIPNATDNCPVVYNSGQADMDHDGHGDACDACPTTPNPGTMPCPVTITLEDVNNLASPNHPSSGTTVTLANLVVTAIRTPGSANAVWVQDPTMNAYAGIELYFGSGSPPTIAVGNTVTVSGSYTLYNGAAEIDSPTLTVTSTTSVAPAPVPACAVDIATGGAYTASLQGMLVQVQGVSDTNNSPPAPTVAGDFQVTGGLVVGDYILAAGGGNPVPMYTAGQGFQSITGVLYQTSSVFKLLPRTPSDVVTR